MRTSLDLEQVQDLRSKLAADAKAQVHDLPDLVDVMMATGLRIGESLAIRWSALDLDQGDRRGAGHARAGQGQGRRAQGETRVQGRVADHRTARWTVDMLRRRRETSTANKWDVVFTSVKGRLRDPSNTQGDLREAFDRAGYLKITSHTMRRTVATLMDEAGLTARAAADQLGHAKVSMTTDHYFGRRKRSTGAAGVLEAVARNRRDDEKGG